MIGSRAPTGHEVLKKEVMIEKQGLIEAKPVRFTRQATFVFVGPLLIFKMSLLENLGVKHAE